MNMYFIDGSYVCFVFLFFSDLRGVAWMEISCDELKSPNDCLFVVNISRRYA